MYICAIPWIKVTEWHHFVNFQNEKNPRRTFSREFNSARCTIITNKFRNKIIKQSYIIASGTDLISLLILLFFVFLLGHRLQKSLRLAFASKQTRMKLGRNVLHVNIYCLTVSIFSFMSLFQDGGHDIMHPPKLLPPGNWTWCVYAAVYTSSWSIVHSYSTL